MEYPIDYPLTDVPTCLEGSNCTLLVVSRNWLENDCQFEFRMAHCLATVEKKRLMIKYMEICDLYVTYIKTFIFRFSKSAVLGTHVF